jgi:hypothetical protein
MDKTILYWTAARQPEDAALSASYDGWFAVQVDVPDPPVKEKSTAQSVRWILAPPERMASV